jgi:hypothetical protein
MVESEIVLSCENASGEGCIFDCGSGCRIASRFDPVYVLSLTYIEIYETAHPVWGGAEKNDREICEVYEVENGVKTDDYGGGFNRNRVMTP